MGAVERECSGMSRSAHAFWLVGFSIGVLQTLPFGADRLGDRCRRGGGWLDDRRWNNDRLIDNLLLTDELTYTDIDG